MTEKKTMVGVAEADLAEALTYAMPKRQEVRALLALRLVQSLLRVAGGDAGDAGTGLLISRMPVGDVADGIDEAISLIFANDHSLDEFIAGRIRASKASLPLLVDAPPELPN